MNKILLEQIVRHVLSSFLVIKSDFINLNKSNSLMNKKFLLIDKLEFEVDDKTIYNDIWGCQIVSEEYEFKILLGNCSIDEVPEYCLVVHLKDSPTYGLYLLDNEKDSNSFMACHTESSQDWLVCNTYLQSTFLAGMETLKEANLNWIKCTNYNSELNSMKLFIKYYNSFYGDNDEG